MPSSFAQVVDLRWGTVEGADGADPVTLDVAVPEVRLVTDDW